MSKERRQFRRVPMGASVSFQELSFHKGAAPEMAEYRDVSSGGLLLSSSHDVPLGTLLKLEIKVPGWGKHQHSFGSVSDHEQRPLVALGQVVRVEALEQGGFELGVKFQNVYPDDLAALTRFVDALAPQTEA